MCKYHHKIAVGIAMVLGCSSLAVHAADQKTKSEENIVVLPNMEVLAEPETISRSVGSGTSLSATALFASHAANVNEVLRKVPGVYVRDEEGLGIRPNIGIRGMNPFRSTKVLFLEDGLPLNFAPYGDNDIYYHPPVERYDRIEVMKGAELTQYGPQTLGGAVNYITPAPPGKMGGYASFTGGTRDYLFGHL
ncbi:MAG: TonB-dependent receptor plug domain-containing protein, partial [Methylococcaceae bacterium]|nr:TonB-dependent receptor plug domain-containing protein [Methylococcaceae bacterium]